MKPQLMGAVCGCLFRSLVTSTYATTIDIIGDNQTTWNCFPFGCPGQFSPSMGFVYQNIPSVTNPFSFNGGGLVIAFVATGAAASDDFTTEQNLLCSHADDTSGYFVGRYYYQSLPTAGTDLTNDGYDFAPIGNVIIGTAVIPIPPAVWLFGSGLLGIAGIARRKKAA